LLLNHIQFHLTTTPLQVTRYITPLREGGSLPAIVEVENGEKYVLKFKGAGQGTKALIAEYIGGKLAQKLGFLVPEIAFCILDEGFGRTEPDEEIQDLLKSSVGLNLGMKFLPGAISFDPAVNHVPDLIASMIVWLDMYLTNVDRTARNTNMLMWKNDLWLIDHGAALYFHHNRSVWETYISKPFPMIKNHVLLSGATKINEADQIIREELAEPFLIDTCSQIPDEWLLSREDDWSAAAVKLMYTEYLIERLKQAPSFVKEIIDAGI
jgi:hypothetical protein